MELKEAEKIVNIGKLLLWPQNKPQDNVTLYSLFTSPHLDKEKKKPYQSIKIFPLLTQ